MPEDGGGSALDQRIADYACPQLHERRRPDDGPREFALAKRLLGRELRAVELHRMVGARAMDGHEDEVLDAGGNGGRNQVLVALYVNGPRSAPAGTEAGDRRNHGPDAD